MKKKSEIKMQYALVNGEKRLPEKGMHGKCPLCGAEVIAKCGTVRTAHWAHTNIDDCDSWSEGKTDWHIGWQNIFPKEWQEVTIAKDGAKHRADVHIPPMQNGGESVLEFQHSFIDYEEIRERESFYPNLVWVVDLTSKKRDSARLIKGLNASEPILGPGMSMAWRMIQSIYDGQEKRTARELFRELNSSGHILNSNIYQIEAEKVFPANWLKCTRPVLFDCAVDAMRCPSLLCLYPEISGHEQRFVIEIQTERFINMSLKSALAEESARVAVVLTSIPDNFHAMYLKELDAWNLNAAFNALLCRKRPFR